MLVGDGAVGKTSIRKRYLGKGFSVDYIKTLGADFAYFESDYDEYLIRYQIWDLVGQESFRSVMKAYFKGCRGALLVYDIAKHITYENTEKWLRGEDGGLPSTVSRFGSTKEEIFMNYEVLKEKYGAEADKLPLGAVGIFSATDKIKVGLQQLMAGSRSWEVQYISRKDIFSLTEECAKVTGIPYVMDAYREEALAIIDS